MRPSQTQVHRFKDRTQQFDRCLTGISLHSHTMHSREYLGRLPSYIAKFPIGSYILEREIGRLHLYEGRIFDFKKVYWTPPLSPREADELERRQIEKIALVPLVSCRITTMWKRGSNFACWQKARVHQSPWNGRFPMRTRNSTSACTTCPRPGRTVG